MAAKKTNSKKQTNGPGASGYEQSDRLAMIAVDRVAGDLFDHVLHQIQRLKQPFADLTERQQQTLADDVESEIRGALRVACHTIASGSPEYIEGTCKVVNIKGTDKAEVKVEIPLPNDRMLLKAAQLSGSVCVVVGASAEEWLAGLGEFKPDPDSPELPLDDGEAVLLSVVDETETVIGHVPVHKGYTGGDVVQMQLKDGELVHFTFDAPKDEGEPGALLYDGDPATLQGLALFRAADAAPA